MSYVEKEAEPVKESIEKLIRNVNQSAKELETDRDLTSYQISIKYYVDILNTEHQHKVESTICNAIKGLAAEVKYLVKCKRVEVNNSQYAEEWKFAAMVFDRLCGLIFITTLLVTLTVTIISMLSQK